MYPAGAIRYRSMDPLLKAIEFKNFKLLRDTVLPLSPFTLIVGANGSGKSTAIQGLRPLALPEQAAQLPRFVSAASTPESGAAVIEFTFCWGSQFEYVKSKVTFNSKGKRTLDYEYLGDPGASPDSKSITKILNEIAVYSIDAQKAAGTVLLKKRTELDQFGHGLTVVLDQMRDQSPERFQALNEEFARWMPEFDCILFDTPTDGNRAIVLRTTKGGHRIPATDISHGTIFALTILTLAYLPSPPPIIGVEEPDRGIHPRLLRNVHDALHRLSHPADFGDTRQPVQVISTTHSPYFLDLFKDHPEEVVVAERRGLEAKFERLTDRPDFKEILGDAPLGDAWYTGVLGGIPPEQ